jgi:DNA-binding NarL/FixJ family response regulator
MIRVAIVDDHPVVADALRLLLAGHDDIQVVGVAGSVVDGRALITQSGPTVVVCDVELGTESGFAVLEERTEGGPAFVMFSAHEQVAYLRRSLDSGASAYVPKTAGIGELVEAIRAAADGRVTFPAEALQPGGRRTFEPTLRELEVMSLVAVGLSNDEIAQRLGVSPRTVESHLRTLFERFSVASRLELVMHAVREGWIPMPDAKPLDR